MVRACALMDSADRAVFPEKTPPTAPVARISAGAPAFINSPEALCGTLRAVRLEEVEEHAQDDYTRNDDGVGYVSEERRHPARHEQDDHQGIREESQ